VSFVAGEVKHGVAEDDIDKGVGKGHVLDEADLEILSGESGFEGGGEFTDVVDGVGVFVEGKDLAALAEKMDEIASVAAAGVEEAHFVSDVAAQELIEDVDIDLSELLLDGSGHVFRIELLGWDLEWEELRRGRGPSNARCSHRVTARRAG
jgi:hypothetical protein